MNFIDAYHTYLSAELSQVFHKKSFRCDEQHFYLLFLHGIYHLLLQLVVLLTVYGGSWNEVR